MPMHLRKKREAKRKFGRFTIVSTFRIEAGKVLQEAVQVRSELEEANEAQRNAESAIDTAKEDIKAADIDLKQVRHLQPVPPACDSSHVSYFLPLGYD